MGLFVWCVTVGQGWWWHDGAGGCAWVPYVIIVFCVSEYWEANILLN
jgi:hypothetical protein